MTDKRKNGNLKDVILSFITLSGGTGDAVKKKRTKVDALIDQLINSAVVGGIAGISTYVTAGVDASVKSALLAGGLAFLIKLKEYRKIE